MIDVIRVPAGTYVLTRGGHDEDDNTEGDLGISESVVIEGVGVLPGLPHLGQLTVATIRACNGAYRVTRDLWDVSRAVPKSVDGASGRYAIAATGG